MSQKKTERLLNLLIALLHTELGISRERLLKDVYGWVPGADRERDAVERQFERDKADLRALGAEILERQGYERADSPSMTSLYRIDPRQFRLPELDFTRQEQSLLALAGLASQGALAGAAARAALRRLEAAGALPDSPPSLVQPRVRLDDPRYATLADAASRRAEVTFQYFATSTGREEERSVQPWGLGQRYGQWYLVGLDTGRQAPRVFRLSRIRGRVSVGVERSFDVPAEGAVHEQLERLSALPEQLARVRIAEGRALELRLTAWKPVNAEAPEGWEAGSYSFRDVTVAADHLAGYGDALVVESPPELARAVVARFEGALAALGTAGAAPVTRGPEGRKTRPSDERFGRIVDLVPYLLQGPVQIGAAAERYGVSPRQLEQELSVLEYTGPTDVGGWQDYIEVDVHDGVVSLANAPELARPRRLSVEEALSLQLGLQTLLPMASADERPTLEALVEKVRAATAHGARAMPEVDVDAEPQRNADLVPLLRTAVADRSTLLLEYLNPTKDERTERLISPLALRSDGDRWYVEAYCHRVSERRVFRVDRIVSLTPADPLPLPPGIEAVLADRLIEPSDADVEAVLRLAPEALWVEHEYAAEDGIDLVDGSRRVRMRVAGLDWLPRFLAQFGGSVALEGPEPAVEACRAWLTRALGASRTG
ncbi:WYL domain-containing protein [Sinomonas sp. ASV322]|uniref:helix-turn-helix transcriptional regulator n=1 Tax=Sinomonas sp. ASV322 TaxID=3041920 RepID=UPI0027DB0280|nr:WYL domain-containing protein [Sinomonas sp. ASV322]MDQ4501030.1 WYL domain-containing protein [Sinomonas sp. ASV322]